MLILDTRTNDLERTRFPQDPISHIFKLIIEASTKLLQVKYSTRSGLDTESLDNDKIRRYTTEMREKYLQEKKHKTNQRALIPSTLLIPTLPTTALRLPITPMK